MSNGSRARRFPCGNQRPVVRPDGAYIVTGGLGGIGLVVARWLVEHGAGRIVLNGRSGPSDEQRAVARRARRTRANRHRHRRYLRTRSGRATRDGRRAKPGWPLRGVVHSAAVIDDQIVAALSRESLERVWAPKAAGALRLHVATAGRELDWWVGFSSTSSLLGSPGQAAYAYASAWLDGLVAWRRASGLPATTINWGQWSDIGVARALTFSALDPIAPPEGIEALEAAIASDVDRVGVARLRLDRAAAAFPEIQQTRVSSQLWPRNWTSTATTTTGRAPMRFGRWMPSRPTGSSPRVWAHAFWLSWATPKTAPSTRTSR